VIADTRIDNIVVAVMRHCIDRTCLFAGVAANADFRIDEMLLDQVRVHVHG
jgi:hypothetical protein